MPATVSLRPFEERDLSLFDRYAVDPGFSGPFLWSGPTDAGAMRRRWADDGFLGRGPRYLAVADETNAAVGWVNWRAHERPGPTAVEIGILLAPEARGRGLGAAAQRLLVDHLFSTTAVHRIWAGTEAGNLAEQRALTRAGLTREGVLRGHHLRDGEWRDSVVFAVLRTDPRD